MTGKNFIKYHEEGTPTSRSAFPHNKFLLLPTSNFITIVVRTKASSIYTFIAAFQLLFIYANVQQANECITGSNTK